MAGRLPGDSHGRQPDWGKPTVRDDTGGLGKHGYGGIVHPPRNRKSGTGNPPPKVRAPEFYPDYDEGLANHIGPEPWGGLREETDEKSVGARVGGVSRRESGLIQSADTGGRVEGNMDGGATASRRLTLRGLRALACAYTPCAGTGRSPD